MGGYRFLQCVNHPDQFNADRYNKLAIGVEIQDFTAPELLDGDWQMRVKSYQERLAGFEGVISMHGAAFDLNPGSIDKKLVALTRERYLQSIQIAQSLGASYVVLHSQINPGLNIPKIREQILHDQIPFWADLLSDTKDIPVTLLLENMFESDWRDLLDLVKTIGSRRVKICLDTGHIKVYAKNAFKIWVEKLLPYMVYVHLSDNEGQYDQHNLPGERMLKDVGRALKNYELNPVVSMEYKPQGLEKEMVRLRNILD